MYFRLFGRTFSVYILVGALMVVVVLFAMLLLVIQLSAPPRSPAGGPTAVFATIPAPTSTSGPPPGAEPTATATPEHLVVNGIGVGMFVQIINTEGAGLRLRSGPGTDAPPRFLGRESEVFEVKDGPRDANGYTWWYLVTPMDESRSGWAASEWLGVVSQPTP